MCKIEQQQGQSVNSDVIPGGWGAPNLTLTFNNVAVRYTVDIVIYRNKHYRLGTGLNINEG